MLPRPSLRVAWGLAAVEMLALPAAAERLLSVSVSDGFARESRCAARPLSFTVTLSAPLPGEAWADVATVDGTATAGADYTATSGRVYFAPGATAATVTVPVLFDTVTETDETFLLRVTAASVPIGDAEGTGTIRNDRCDDGNACTVDIESCQGMPACSHLDANACATPACALPGGCAEDADHDGLSDAWEQNGYVDVDCNGRYDGPLIDIPLPGADPAAPDLYVQYDYMIKTGPGAHTHDPPPLALQIVSQAFAAHGVRLHWLAPAEGIPEHVVTTLDPAPKRRCAGNDYTTMEMLRAARLSNRKPAYHYLVFAHRATCPDAEHCTACPADPECGGRPDAIATGSADLPGDDVIVSTGAYFDGGTQLGIETLASTILHEIGHNLGLKHGADDACVNKKPNYISAMNYAYQLVGIPVAVAPGSTLYRTCLLDADCGPPVVASGRCAVAGACHCTDDMGPVLGSDICFRTDYSDLALPTLNELVPVPGVGGLDENAGVAGPASNDDIVSYFAPGPVVLLGASNGSPIDWNQNGVFETHVASDLNNDNFLGLMTTWNDWAMSGGSFLHLDFRFQCTGGYGARPQARWMQ